MGSFASGIFSAMLGWIRGAIAYLWNAAATPEGGGLLSWMADNWLPLTLILCVAGMVIDLVVYLLRWQPYKVWASFFRRLGRHRKEEAPAQPRPRPARPQRTVHRQWLYADGTARTEAIVQDVHPEEDPAPWQHVSPAVAGQELNREEYMRQYARPEEQTSAVVSAPGLEDYPQPSAPVTPVTPVTPAAPQPQEAPEPVSRSRRMVRQSTKAAFQQLFASHDEDELDLRYKPAQPPVDKEQAYNKPYYPPQWKPPAGAGASRGEQ
ncbi:MAG: hypothetical protein ACI4O7_07290 [Aristaeellaceae bacterium]